MFHLHHLKGYSYLRLLDFYFILLYIKLCD